MKNFRLPMNPPHHLDYVRNAREIALRLHLMEMPTIARDMMR